MSVPEICVRQSEPRPWTRGVWASGAVACVAGLVFWLTASSQGQTYNVGQTSQGVLEWSRNREVLDAPSGSRISKVIPPSGTMLSAGQPVALLDWSKARRTQRRDKQRLVILTRAVLCLQRGPYSKIGAPRTSRPLEKIFDPVAPGCRKLDMKVLTQLAQNKGQIAALHQQFRLITRATDLILRDISQPDGAAIGNQTLAKSLETYLKRADATARLNREAVPLLAQWMALEGDRKAQIRALNIAISSLHHRMDMRRSIMSDPYLRAASVGILDTGDPDSDKQTITVRGMAQFGLVLQKPFAPSTAVDQQYSVVVDVMRRSQVSGARGRSSIVARASRAVVGANGISQYNLFLENPEQSASLLSQEFLPGTDGVTRAGVRVSYLAKAPNILAAAKTALCSYDGITEMNICTEPLSASLGKEIN